MSTEHLINTSIVISMLSIGIIAITFLIMFVMRRGVFGGVAHQQLRRTKITAQAKIVRMWETGIMVNKNPQVGLLLEVMSEGHTTYQTEIKSIISRLYIPQIQPGVTVPVRYDPMDPQKVVLAL
ncbi:MAG: DUF3592 domain-containing protein [Chloroflexota bacterium]